MSLGLDEIAVGVFTSALNLRERAFSVQETWLKAFPKGYLIGGRYHDQELKLISLGEGVGEDYRSAHRKQFLGLLELRSRFPEAKWFYVTGCDAFIFAENLRDLLDGLDHSRELLVGGHCGLVEVDGEPVLYPAGGPGFALSLALLDSLAGVMPSFVEEWERRPGGIATACDLAMAYLALRERGVRLTYAEGFYYGPPYYYPGNTYKDGAGMDVDRAPIEKPIAFHNLSIREMYVLDAGRLPERPRFLDRCFDKAARIASRRLGTRTLVNRASRALYGRRT